MSRRKKIQQRMQDMDIHFRDIAQYIMLSVNSILLWLDEKIKIPYIYVWKISELLNIDCDDLIEI